MAEQILTVVLDVELANLSIWVSWTLKSCSIITLLFYSRKPLVEMMTMWPQEAPFKCKTLSSQAKFSYLSLYPEVSFSTYCKTIQTLTFGEGNFKCSIKLQVPPEMNKLQNQAYIHQDRRSHKYPYQAAADNVTAQASHGPATLFIIWMINFHNNQKLVFITLLKLSVCRFSYHAKL